MRTEVLVTPVEPGVDLVVRAVDTGFLIIDCLYCLRSSSLCFCLSGLHPL